MEKNIAEYKYYDGTDADLETSLFEYGLIWIKGAKDHENDYHFIYGVGLDSNGNYNLFDWGDVAIDCNPEKEWDFVEFDKVAECNGMSKADFLKMPLPLIVESLVSYYGYENIFGSSYYPFTIKTMEV